MNLGRRNIIAIKSNNKLFYYGRGDKINRGLIRRIEVRELRGAAASDERRGQSSISLDVYSVFITWMLI